MNRHQRDGGSPLTIRGPRLSSGKPSARGSYPQARIAGNELGRLEAVNDHELLPAGGSRDEPDRPARNVELVRQQAQQRLVGRATDRGRRDVGPEYAIDDAIDVV